MPLHGPHDTRVAVRDQELDELWEIAGECVAEIEAWDAAPDPAPLDVERLARAIRNTNPKGRCENSIVGHNAVCGHPTFQTDTGHVEFVVAEYARLATEDKP